MNWIDRIRLIKLKGVFVVLTFLWFEIVSAFFLLVIFSLEKNDMMSYLSYTFIPNVISLFLIPFFLFLVISKLHLFQDEKIIIRFKNRSKYWNFQFLNTFLISVVFSFSYLLVQFVNGLVFGLNFNEPIINYLMRLLLFLMGLTAVGLFFLVIELAIKRYVISLSIVIAWIMSELFNFNPLHFFVWQMTLNEGELGQLFFINFISLVGLCVILYFIGLNIIKFTSLINPNIKQEGGNR